MSNSIKKLLQLEGFHVSRPVVMDGCLELHITSYRKTAVCPRCHHRSKQVHQYAMKMVKHSQISGQEIRLHLCYRRFKCRQCRKPFSEHLALCDRWQRHTQIFERSVIDELSGMSFKSAARHHQVAYSTLQRILLSAIDPFRIDWGYAAAVEVIILGIDEHSFQGHRMLTKIVDIKNKKILAVLPDDRKTSLKRWLADIPEEVKSKITEVCTDMRTSFINASREELPNAHHVIDRFHVIALANRLIQEECSFLHWKTGCKQPRRLCEKARENLTNEEQKKLEALLTQEPSLREVYEIKEELRVMYCQKNRTEAACVLNALIARAQHSANRSLHVFVETLSRLHGYMLNYFYSHTTNGFTEGVVTKIKMIKRLGFGYRNIEVYIRKVMLAFLPLTVFPVGEKVAHFLT